MLTDKQQLILAHRALLRLTRVREVLEAYDTEGLDTKGFQKAWIEVRQAAGLEGPKT